MNDFGLNEAELNGQMEVWLAAPSVAAIALQETVDITRWKLGEGAPQIQFSNSTDITVRRSLVSTAQVVLDGSWIPSVRKSVEGAPQIVMAATHDLTRWAKSDGTASMVMAGGLDMSLRIGLLSTGPNQIVLTAAMPPQVRKFMEGNSQVVMTAICDLVRRANLMAAPQVVLAAQLDLYARGLPRGDAKIVFDVTGDFTIGSASRLEGMPAYIENRATVLEDSRPGTMLKSLAQTWLNATGKLNAKFYSNAGAAQMSLTAGGEARSGSKVKLEGQPASVVMYSTGELGGIHYEYLSADAAIELLSHWNPTGYPVPPDQYIPAQDGRVMFVPQCERTLNVPRECKVCA